MREPPLQKSKSETDQAADQALVSVTAVLDRLASWARGESLLWVGGTPLRWADTAPLKATPLGDKPPADKD